jgi:hypothetical protein
MKLVDNWKSAWRWLSVQAMTISAIVPAAWLSVPEDMRAAVPADWLAYAAITLAGLGIIGRLVKQDD